LPVGRSHTELASLESDPRWPVFIEQVGLIYGPSGCGKSSLVKAGLLPRLSADVIAVYIEATPEETETRLLHGLRKRCPALEDNLSLTATLAALRRGQSIPVGKKVLIVLDQFEQWLHAKKEEENTDLVQALRQCDGGRVQCIVMVRDDFWMAATRFMRELEIRLLEGQNSAAVDLFDMDHARKILAAFGRAFGKLPENASETEKEQKEFLKQAVSGLAQEGKVISVRLALFAEMMKGKAWTPNSLKAVGGTEGVGITFLEETFSAATAPPEHRYHQKAARADLKILLPETGSDIKGHMRCYAELLEASGYGSRPKDFDDLIRILDNEIRLITPTDPEGKDAISDSVFQSQPGQKYYQLTHDYLVHSIREWLTRKQKETRRGRAQLLLADRAAVWNARPEHRQLPSLLQWFTIRWWTPKTNWTPPQKRMMSRAGTYHAVRGLVLLLVLALVGWGVFEGHGTLKAHALRDRLVDANTNEVPTIVHAMGSIRRWINPLLHEAYVKAEAARDARKQLHASLALLPVDGTQVNCLYDRLLGAEPQSEPLVATLIGTIDRKLPADRPAADESRETLAKRQANAAVALLRMNQPETVWPLLKHSSDPRLRSYLIHRLSPMGADPEALIKRLREEPDITIRRALLLSLGEFNEKELPPASRTSLLPKLQTIYPTDADPGLHAAAEWLLRTWKQEAWLNQVNEEWAKDKEQRPKRLQAIQQQLKASRAASAPGIQPQWYVNGQGQTMVVIPGPVEFVMGSPTSEAGRVPNENQHRRRIGRTFALAAKSVKLAE
jgi:eukaryotic-like serine/threonine-protein kinase